MALSRSCVEEEVTSSWPSHTQNLFIKEYFETCNNNKVLGSTAAIWSLTQPYRICRNVVSNETDRWSFWINCWQGGKKKTQQQGARSGRSPLCRPDSLNSIAVAMFVRGCSDEPYLQVRGMEYFPLL